MTSIEEQKRELITLTKLHIKNTYKKGAWKFTDPDCYTFFRDRAKPKKEESAPTPPLQLKKEVAPPIKEKTPEIVPRAAKKEPVPVLPLKKTDVPQANKSEGKGFVLEPVKEVKGNDLTEICKQIKGVKFVENPPEPMNKACRIADASILIVTDNKMPPNHQLFLANIAKALKGATLLQKNALDKVQPHQILICPKNISTSASVISIEEPTTYLKEPQKKRELYEQLQKVCLMHS